MPVRSASCGVNWGIRQFGEEALGLAWWCSGRKASLRWEGR